MRIVTEGRITGVSFEPPAVYLSVPKLMAPGEVWLGMCEPPRVAVTVPVSLAEAATVKPGKCRFIIESDTPQ